MNSRGFVYIDEILKFPQMKRIGASRSDLVKLTIESSHLELSRDERRIRTKPEGSIDSSIIPDFVTDARVG